jgi:hypothetical protein
LIRWARNSVPAPTSRNGIFGRPGITHSASAAPPAIRSASLFFPSWVTTLLPMSPELADRVVIRPVATDSSSAGICETRPSPTLSRLYWFIASAGDRPCCSMPTAKPPTRLITVMMMAAMASPLTNLDPPSMAP